MAAPWRTVAFILHVIASTLALVVVIVFATGGLRFRLGAFLISATQPGRIALQAAIVWLVATLASTRRQRGFVMVPILAVMLASWLDSHPRRVGDGDEYMAMALNMSHGLPPALSRDEWVTRSEELRNTAGFEESNLVPPLPGINGRQDFHHFWLYSMLAAPLVATARLAGAHPNHAFTILNISLLGSFLWLLVRRGHSLAAGLIVAGPLMWWVDKAHTEIFLFVTIAAAVLLVEDHPAFALLSAGLAAAQNPAATCVLAGIAVYALYRERSSRIVAAVGAAVVIALILVAYYEWRIGVPSPLADSVRMTSPSIRALITPLFDPNLGLAPYAPVLFGIALAGLFVRRSTTALVFGIVVGLLLVFAATGNVNHGGTPGMSRYGLWLLAAMTPLVATGSDRLGRHQGLAIAALCVSCVVSLMAFRPAWLERREGPSGVAAMLWSRWPALDNPLPEVFAERVTGVDGAPPVPAATQGCRKILIRGDGTDAWWPFPCEPAAAPPACVRINALCYVNNGVFSPAPTQPRFTFDPAAARAWSLREHGLLRDVARRLGPEAHSTSLVAGARQVVGGDALLPLFIVEGETGTAIWARTRPSSQPTIRLRAGRPSQIEVWHVMPFTPLNTWRVGAGIQSIHLPANEETLVLITDTQ